MNIVSITTEHQAMYRVIELVRDVKAKYCLLNSPQYRGVGDPIAAKLGIEVREVKHLPSEGMYLKETSQKPPTIVIDSKITDRSRRNFTFFHELCHHLIRQDDELYSFLHEYTSYDEDHQHKAIENYCNIGAAEFLVPREDVRKAISEQGFSINIIEELDRSYPASKPAIAIQLAQCALHKCFVVICEYGVVPQQKTRQKELFTKSKRDKRQLYILYSSSSPSNKYRIGRFVTIPENHVLMSCFNTKQRLKDYALIPFRSGTIMERECEAFFYKGKVYAVFHVDPAPPPNVQQLSMF